MSGKRKSYSADFKYKIAQEAIKNDNISEISRKYNVPHNVICEWRKTLNNQGHNIFKTNPDKENEKLKKVVGRLEQMLGKKEVELNLLKNFSDFYKSHDGT